MRAAGADPVAEAVEVQIEYRRREKRQELRHEQTTKDGDAERTAKLRPFGSLAGG